MSEKIISIVEVDGWDAAGFDIKTTDQVIELRIENKQDCCEDWGYFITNDTPDDFLNADVIGVEIVDTCLKTFDRELYEGDVMFVNIKTSDGVLQFTAYNSHNGWYGHTASVKSMQLNEDRVL